MRAIYPDGTDNSFAGVVDRLLGFAGRDKDAVGGVARTLIEAFAREMAIFYATLESAHRAGFLDTAAGPALDHVVSILGLQRRRAGRLTGKVEFSRSTPAQQDIVIPAGRRVTGVQGDKALPLFETAQEVTILRGETRAVADVQEIPDADAKAPPLLNPGVLTIMPRPVLGVEAVVNVEPMRQLQADESDDNLRTRARAVLRESQRGTLDAIVAAIREQGILSVDVREADDIPGVLDIVMNSEDLADPQIRARVENAIRASKPAGIHVRVATQYSLPFRYSAELELVDPALNERSRLLLAAELAGPILAAARAFKPGAAVRKQKLDGLLLGSPAIAGVRSSSLTALPAPHTTNRPAAERVLAPGGDLYVYPDEAVTLAPVDVILTWARTRRLALELVVTKAGTTDATRAAAREAVGQYTAFLRAGGQPAHLFDDLAARLLGAGITLTTLTATRDGAVTVEQSGEPSALTIQPDEVLFLEDVEVLG